MFWFKNLRRKRIARKPFPADWLKIIEANVPFYNRLPADDKIELQCHILIFIAEKQFEGCGGLTITDEIKVTIAAQACILILHRKTDYYPGLSVILVYPQAFIAPRTLCKIPGIMTENSEVLLGESWSSGSIVLSWGDIKKGTSDISDGHNVVFHEFAHQIDSSCGKGDHSKVLENRSSYIAWARALQQDYQLLRQAASENQPSFLDKYGASDPAEFFAVATEFFFEKPRELKEKHLNLYLELMRFYQQDPAGYF
jgi:MtfA peptidase